MVNLSKVNGAALHSRLQVPSVRPDVSMFVCVSVLRAEVFVVVSSPQCLITGQMDGWADVRSLYQQSLGS